MYHNDLRAVFVLIVSVFGVVTNRRVSGVLHLVMRTTVKLRVIIRHARRGGIY